MGTTVFPKPLNQDVSGKQDKNDNSLETTSKTVVGAINEVNQNLSNKVGINTEASLTAIELSPSSSTAGHGGYIDFHFNKSSSDFTSRIIESASGNIEINGISITELNSKLAKQSNASPIYTYGTLADLKAGLLTIANGMSAQDVQRICFVTNFTDDVFQNGNYYVGDIHINSKGDSWNYFSVLVQGLYGKDVVSITNSNTVGGGSWTIDKLALNSQITTLNDQMATLYPPANGKYFGYVTFNGATYTLFINLGRNIINNYNIVASGSVEVVGISAKPVTSYSTWQGCGINVEAENTVQANAGKGAFVSLSFTRKS